MTGSHALKASTFNSEDVATHLKPLIINKNLALKRNFYAILRKYSLDYCKNMEVQSIWSAKVTQGTKLSKLYVEISLEMCAFHNFALPIFTIHLRDKADLLTNINGDNIKLFMKKYWLPISCVWLKEGIIYILWSFNCWRTCIKYQVICLFWSTCSEVFSNKLKPRILIS